MGTDARIDVNKATPQELASVDGIGAAMATRIVDYREEHGPFPTVARLTDVPRLGSGTLAEIEDQLTTGNGPRPTTKAARNEEIVASWKIGGSPAHLGRDFGVSATRVRIIIGNALMKEYRQAHPAPGKEKFGIDIEAD